MEKEFLILLLIGSIVANPIGQEPTGPAPEKDTSEDPAYIFEQTQTNLFEGDIEVDLGRAAVVDELKKWDFPVHYFIPGTFPFNGRRAIKLALSEIAVRTCIPFAPRTTEIPYINIAKGTSGCSSGVGAPPNGDFTTITLSDACYQNDIIIHETMHALGFYHEQSRPDRDQYVFINTSNINSGSLGNFDLNDAQATTTDGLAYDYISIMHYGQYAFAIDGSIPTITALDSSITLIGRQGYLTSLDVQRLNLHYGCPAQTYDSGGFTSWTEYSDCDIDCKKTRKRFRDGSTEAFGEVQTEEVDCTDCVIGRDPDCGAEHLTAVSGELMSPLYPDNYKPNLICVTHITVPEGLIIMVEFASMDVEDWNGGCYYDFLYIYDGPDESSPQLAKLCSVKTPDYVASSSNELTIVFDSDVSVTGKGYYATYAATAAPIFECLLENLAEDCRLRQDYSTFNWTIMSGGTPTGGTGPSFDHTHEGEFGSQIGKYIYFETSDFDVTKPVGAVARIYTKEIEGSSFGICLKFWYSMYGSNMGSLNVVTYDGVSMQTEYTRTGTTVDNRWYQAQVTITRSGVFEIGFEAVKGSNWLSDIGIDDIFIFPGAC